MCISLDNSYKDSCSKLEIGVYEMGISLALLETDESNLKYPKALLEIEAAENIKFIFLAQSIYIWIAQVV